MSKLLLALLGLALIVVSQIMAEDADMAALGKRTLALGRFNFRPGKRTLALGRFNFRPGKRAFEAEAAECKPTEVADTAKMTEFLVSELEKRKSYLKVCAPGMFEDKDN